MESCVGKSVMSGGMGFALGGLFGVFLSSVCLSLIFALVPSLSASGRTHSSPQTCLSLARLLSKTTSRLTHYPRDGTDELRQPLHRARRGRPGLHLAAHARAAPARLQGHGLAQLLVRQAVRHHRAGVFGDGVLHRRRMCLTHSSLLLPPFYYIHAEKEKNIIPLQAVSWI